MDKGGTSAGRYCLSDISDEELLVGTRSLVGRSNQILAALLAHLAEVEARGIHRARACASLYTYCLYELRMSEDSALRRARAARVVRQFPAVLEHVAAGELHLTGLLMLAPHLTEQNQHEVLARAKHRSKREIAALVRQLNPLPSVAAVVEPLGPETGPGLPMPGRATWKSFVGSLAGPVRDLPPAQRPCNFAEDPTTDDPTSRATPGATADAGGKDTVGHAASTDDASTDDASTDDASTDDASTDSASETSPLDAPQRYKVQFTATQEYVDLLRQAQDLLANVVPRRALEEVHLRAMRALVAELRRQKCAARRSPRGVASLGDNSVTEPLGAPATRAGAGQEGLGREDPEDLGAAVDGGVPANHRRKRTGVPQHNRDSRYIPAGVRRQVWQRDGARCTYVSAFGERCRETAHLELHHDEPYARGGRATAENLRLVCRSHNLLEAEEDFGRGLVGSLIHRRRGTEA
jgi:hypothetical protein